MHEKVGEKLAGGRGFVGDFQRIVGFFSSFNFLRKKVFTFDAVVEIHSDWFLRPRGEFGL